MQIEIEHLGHVAQEDMRQHLCYQAVKQIYSHWTGDEIAQAIARYRREQEQLRQEQELAREIEEKQRQIAHIQENGIDTMIKPS